MTTTDIGCLLTGLALQFYAHFPFEWVSDNAGLMGVSLMAPPILNHIFGESST